MQQLCQTCFSCGKIIQRSGDILRKDNCTVDVRHSQRKEKDKINPKIQSISLFFSPCFILWRAVKTVLFVFILVYSSIMENERVTFSLRQYEVTSSYLEDFLSVNF